jgi:hypothetical protein
MNLTGCSVGHSPGDNRLTHTLALGPTRQPLQRTVGGTCDHGPHSTYDSDSTRDQRVDSNVLLGAVRSAADTGRFAGPRMTFMFHDHLTNRETT